MERLLNFTRTASVLLLGLLLLKLIPIFVPHTEFIQLLSTAAKMIVLLIFFGIFINESEHNAVLRPYAIAGLVGIILQIASLSLQVVLQHTGAYQQMAYAGIINITSFIFTFIFFWLLGSAVTTGPLRVCAHLTAVLPILITLIQSFLPSLILTQMIGPEDHITFLTISYALFAMLDMAVYAWFFHTFHRQFK